MTGLDFVIIAVVLLSAAVGVVRGFIRETFSLVSWILALWVAFSYAEAASGLFADYISQPPLRIGAAFGALFVAALLLLTVISFLLHRLLAVEGIRGTDRVLGGLFGVLRALVLLAGLMLLARLANLPQEPWWQQSVLVDHFKPLVVLLYDLLPADIAQHLQERR